MLIRLKVKNFLSFDKRDDGKAEEFSMLAGKVRNKKEHIYDNEKIKLLKFAAIYGANASGKSNLVKVFDFIQKTVVKGLPKGHIGKYCKVVESNKDCNSYFEIEIMLNDKYYAYGFEVILSKSKFVSEWLVELTSDNREKLIYNRDIANAKYEFCEDFKKNNLLERLEIYADDVKADSSVLFLSLMNKNKVDLYRQYANAKIFADVYTWIKSSLDINFPDRPISDYSYMAQEENVEDVCRIISAFGTGISGFDIVEVDPEKVIGSIPLEIRNRVVSALEHKVEKMRSDDGADGVSFVMRSPKDFFVLMIDKDEKVMCKTIRFSHGEQKTLFNLSEESDGTVRILDLLEVLLSEENTIFVIDELDRCLHPSMTYKFVESFLKLASKKNIQLIVTTHESRLLDFDLLRRDEVWFVNKRNSGVSDVYSLEEYNTRFDQKIDKAYLEGRYGGVPIFSTVFPVLDEVNRK